MRGSASRRFPAVRSSYSVPIDCAARSTSTTSPGKEANACAAQPRAPGTVCARAASAAISREWAAHSSALCRSISPILVQYSGPSFGLSSRQLRYTSPLSMPCRLLRAWFTLNDQ
ncbi:hypothetical protein [Streptomyces sudanensis]|uniref:hypothetical protein n=1 Tax=Streptomyces sudanensis TaxID=436397 RepID=UPI0020CE983B|nr:hypothetical protein [Streptomyces sudanensis]MCQ0000653.1 hypothetical protein [Streptomyces sudanensis]